MTTLATIQKTYALETSVESDHCAAEVNCGDDMVELCRGRVEVTVVITTIAANGRRYRSRVGFCRRHVPKKYRRWFKMPYGVATSDEVQS